jgi:acetolactate synthase-1/2/3 large subunit
MDEADIPHLGTDVTTHDLPAIARGFGCDGVRVATPQELQEQVRVALGASGPTVIELRA